MLDAGKAQEKQIFVAIASHNHAPSHGVPLPTHNRNIIPKSEYAETKRLENFCDTIVKADTKIDKALRQNKRGQAVLTSILTDSSAQDIPTEGMSDEELRRKYEAWAKSVVYGHYNWEIGQDDEPNAAPEPDYNHAFSKKGKAITSYPARNMALMKEVRAPHV